MTQVILTMTTVPSRMDSTLFQSLKVLSDLNHDDYELHLNLPAIYKPTKEKYVAPSWIADMRRVKVFEGLEDMGPKTKIIPTLLRVEDPDAIIITVDDDIIYNRDLIEYHLKKRLQYPDAALGFSGTVRERMIFFTAKDVEVDILDNYKTASYKRSMFDADFFDRYAGQSWNDDIVVSAYFRDKGIKKIVLAYDKETFFYPRVKSFPILNIIEQPMTGCDLFRGHPHKNNSIDLQKMYEEVMP
jgi:hypothetical protein